MPPDPLAWHHPFGARSFASPSKKKILGGPKDDFGGGPHCLVSALKNGIILVTQFKK